MCALSRRSFLGSTALGSAAALGGVAAAEGSARAAAEAKLPGDTPHTRFAVNVEMWWSRDRVPFLDRIRRAAELGFPAVEFWPWQNKDLDATASLAEELDVEIAQFTAWGFVPGLNDPKNHDAFLKAIEEGCQAAHKLRCKKMTVVGGNDQKGMTQAEMHEHIITGLKRAAPIAEAEDVMLILEPMNIRVDHKGHCLYGSPRRGADLPRSRLEPREDQLGPVPHADLRGRLVRAAARGLRSSRLLAAGGQPRPQRAGHRRDLLQPRTPRGV